MISFCAQEADKSNGTNIFRLPGKPTPLCARRMLLSLSSIVDGHHARWSRMANGNRWLARRLQSHAFYGLNLAWSESTIRTHTTIPENFACEEWAGGHDVPPMRLRLAGARAGCDLCASKAN